MSLNAAQLSVLLHFLSNSPSLPVRSGEFVLRELPAQVQPGRGAERVGGRAGGHQPRPERPAEEHLLYFYLLLVLLCLNMNT